MPREANSKKWCKCKKKSTLQKKNEKAVRATHKPLICGNFATPFLLHFNYFHLTFSLCLSPLIVDASHRHIDDDERTFSTSSFLLIYFLMVLLFPPKVSIITSLCFVSNTARRLSILLVCLSLSLSFSHSCLEIKIIASLVAIKILLKKSSSLKHLRSIIKSTSFDNSTM